jgi:hypothetical protein
VEPHETAFRVGAPVTRETDGARTVSLVERPDLAGAIPEVLASRWPRFLLAGCPGHEVDLTGLAMAVPTHQILLLDAADELLGVGLSLPLSWDGSLAGLPEGWDGAMTAAAALLEHGGAPTAIFAVSITMTAAGVGRRLSARMVEALKAAASRAGVSHMIAPVRPTLKARYPLIPLEKYLAWRSADGEIFDPWIRLHLRLGGDLAGVACPSMTITGTVADWETWIDLPLPGSGEYVIPGALVPLQVDFEADTGVYREPNIWILHRTT